jgi:hypothetical protein
MTLTREPRPTGGAWTIWNRGSPATMTTRRIADAPGIYPGQSS